MRGWRGAELDQLNPYRDGFAVVLISTPALAGAATQAVQQAGGRVMRSIDWPAVAEEIGRQAGRPLLLIDTHGAPATAMEVALARIDAVATALDLPIVVSLSTRDIDRRGHAARPARCHAVRRQRTGTGRRAGRGGRDQ